MSRRKTKFASTLPLRPVYELPDCYMYVRIEPFAAKARILPYIVKRRSNSLDEIKVVNRYLFKFTKIFDQDSTQTEVFDNSVRGRIIDFINGKHSLIYTYGSSYTLMTLCGTIRNPGIIPRSMEFLFSSVRCSSEPWCRISEFNRFVVLNEQQRVKEREFKNKVLNYFKPHVNVTSLLTNCSFKDFESNDQGQSADTNILCIWIAAFSVLDNKYYDEIDVGSPPVDGSVFGNYFNFGPKMKFVHVSTAMEAYQLIFGITLKRRLSDVRKERRFNLQVVQVQCQKENPGRTVTANSLTFGCITNDKPVERRGVPDWPILKMRFQHKTRLDTTTTYIANVDMDRRYFNSAIYTLECASETV